MLLRSFEMFHGVVTHIKQLAFGSGRASQSPFLSFGTEL